MKRVACLVAAACLASACGRNGSDFSGAKPKQGQTARRLTDDEVRNLPDFKKLPPERVEKYLKQRREDAEERPRLLAEWAKVRAELVRAAPPGWKPQSRGKKLKLTLIPKQTTAKVGERFWFLLELQNIGDEPKEIFEGQSYFKSGGMGLLEWLFFVNGKRVMQSVLGPDIHHSPEVPYDPYRPFSPPGFERLSENEKSAYVQRVNRESRQEEFRQQTLHLTLAPGETLVTRPWRFYNPTEAMERRRANRPKEPVKGPFRQLGNFEFDRPGKHTFQSIHAPIGPYVPDETHFQTMEKRGVSREQVIKMREGIYDRDFGPLESNIVEVTVVP